MRYNSFGVFSVISKQVSLNEILKYELPYAEDSSIFSDNPHFLHPLSETEIIVWDSSYVQIMSKDDNLISCLEKEFPKEKYYKKWR